MWGGWGFARCIVVTTDYGAVSKTILREGNMNKGHVEMDVVVRVVVMLVFQSRCKSFEPANLRGLNPIITLIVPFVG